MNIQEAFNKEVLSLIGKECWGVVGGVGVGSTISLSMGDKYPKSIHSKNMLLSEDVRKNDSEFSLMIYCPWRIEDTNRIFCGSHHSNEMNGPYQDSFNRITGAIITNVICTLPAYDLKLVFNNGISINIVCVSIVMEENECYSFGTRKGWFSVYFDGLLELEKNA